MSYTTGGLKLSRLSGPGNTRLTKEYRLAQGSIQKVSQPDFYGGQAKTETIPNLKGIERLTSSLGSNECIATGVFDIPACNIVTKAKYAELSDLSGIRTRSKDHMKQPERGLILLDHDTDPHMPESIKADTPQMLMEKLAPAIPKLAEVAYSGSGSSSSGIYSIDFKVLFSGGGGLHVYVATQGIDLPRLQQYLRVKLWNAGLGYIGFARNGAMLTRFIIDLSVLSSERLIYEASPILGEGVGQHKRQWHHHDGVDFSDECELTVDEIATYEKGVAEAKVHPDNVEESRVIQEEYHNNRVNELASIESISVDEAKVLLPRRSVNDWDGSNQLLALNDVIEINGQKLLASELLARGKEFDNKSIPDPIEGSSYGTGTAMFYFNDGKQPCIHSFAHGMKTIYRFESQHMAIRKLSGVHTASKALVHVHNAGPLDPGSFPNKKISNSNNNLTLLGTIPNIEHLLKGYGVTVKYDVIRKEIDIRIPGISSPSENITNVMLENINSLAALNGVPQKNVLNYVSTIADANPVNPIANWINSIPWDGNDRLPALCNTVTARNEFPNDFKETLIKKFLLSAVAAALMAHGFSTRGVLTFQGKQGLGKTRWLSALITDRLLRDKYMLTGHHLDPSNKDSLITAIKHWVVELGELDSSFKKDIARLKGFITADKDTVRRPYARTNAEYQRRTVFCASVNEENFLIDPTGNTRFWAIPVVKLDYEHDIDMQQVFAQLAIDLSNGVQWWLTDDEEKQLEEQNKAHRAISSLEERLLTVLDFDMPTEKWLNQSATETLQSIGIRNPSNQQCRECGGVLRERFGGPKKVQGIMKWKIPLKPPGLMI